MLRLTYAEWGQREYSAMLGALLHGRLAAEEAVDRLVAALKPYLADRTLLPTNRGRTALAIALAVFKEQRPDRTEVIVPSFICPSVVDAVEAAGLSILPVDIGADLNIDPAAIADAVGPRTLAVIAAHMYGAPARIAEIEDLCRSRNVFLIDDAAQVVGIHAGSRPLGTFGDVGIVSFSQSKTIVAGALNCGGLLILGNDALAEPMHRHWRALPPGHCRIGDLLAFLWSYQAEAATERPTNLYEAMMRRLGIEPAPHIEKTLKMSGVSAAIALEQLKSLSRRIAGRKRVLQLYDAGLRDGTAATLPQYAPDQYLARFMLLLPRGTSRTRFRAALRQEGVRTRRSYQVVPGPGGQVPRRAAEIAARLVELPSDSRMSAATVAEICEKVKRFASPETLPLRSVEAAASL